MAHMEREFPRILVGEKTETKCVSKQWRKRGEGASIVVETRQGKLVAEGEVQKHCKGFVLHGTDVWQALYWPLVFQCYIIGGKARTPLVDVQ